MNDLPGWIQILGSLAAALGLVGGPILAYRSQSSTSRSTQTDIVIKAMQQSATEDRVKHEMQVQHLASERAEDKAELGEIKTVQNALGRKMYVLEDYIGALRLHISEQKPPPPPPWPKELQT